MHLLCLVTSTASSLEEKQRRWLYYERIRNCVLLQTILNPVGIYFNTSFDMLIYRIELLLSSKIIWQSIYFLFYHQIYFDTFLYFWRFAHKR